MIDFLQMEDQTQKFNQKKKSMKLIKRPSIFRQQQLSNEEPDEIMEGLPTVSTIYMTSNSINSVIPTYNNISNASTKMCISIPSTKATARKCSVDSSHLGFFQSMNFKTEPCKYWKSGMESPFANNCRFAHGQVDKRSKQVTKDLYKTKVCKSFFDSGSCKYGLRCQFLHQKTPYERQKQYYRKRMSQIHKDTEWFFMDKKRLSVLRLIQLGEDKQNTPTPPSSENSISSSNSIKKKGEKSAFSLSEYCKTSKKGRNFSICL